MVKIRIDNREYEVAEGSTVLEAASAAGLTIPTLCHKEGMPHYSSCMVCMVNDRSRNTFLPSCSALVRDGMDIDASGQEVVDIRKKALEMLFSEHRAECEAPCRIVCPAGYNIPLMNRLFSSKDFNGAIQLIASEIGSGEISCINCKAYCENACRRKKIDNPVSIRNTKLFISQEIKAKGITSVLNEAAGIIGKKSRPFSSRTGKIEATELQEWLKECIDDVSRHRDITDYLSAEEESGSCMHCDCRAAGDCRLRELAQSFELKDPPKIVNAPIVKKINHNTGLIFENAKCIKCGLCVRLCEDTPDEPALCFIQRGFVSIISEPLGMEFDDVLKTRSKAVVDICPTGALSMKENFD
jgi:predicted molibdopterin-dependent oxidoreductase YjgC